jgi:predicted ATPase
MSLTLSRRVVAHLATHPVEEGAASVPREITQEGIAEALSAQVAHVSRALKSLVAEGLVHAYLAHPRGGKRRSRAHVLTDAGRRLAATLPREPAATVARAAPPTHAPPVTRVPAGRERAFADLVALHESSLKEGPRIALVEGGAGMGKTRLLAAFAAEVAKRGARVLAGASVPVGGEQWLGPLAPALAPLGLEARQRARTAGTPRERALDAARETLLAGAAASPLVLVLDDLHHAGPGAVEFLHGLFLALPQGTRVLVVAAFRREEAWALPNGPLYTALMPLRDLPRAKLLTLQPLDRAGVAALLADAGVHVLGDAKLPDALVERVWRESGGNPHFALAMGAELADGVDEEDFFPVGVQNAARERFASLAPEQLAVLQLAAVAGAEFPYDVLARAYDGPEDQLVGILDFLLDRLLLEESAGEGGRELALRFEHPKVRETVLADLTANRRRWLEGRVAAGHAA